MPLPTTWTMMDNYVTPENYQQVSYILEPEGDSTKLTIIQEGNKTEESAKHSEANWNTVLEAMKKLVESQSESQ